MTLNPRPTSAGQPAGPSRRRFLQLGGYAVVGLAASRYLLACSDDETSSGGSSSGGGSTEELTNFSVQLSWVKDAEWSPLFLADANGHFADNGVEVELVAGGADIGAIEGLVAGGQSDIGISTDITSVVAAIADGNPLVILGSLYQTNLNVFMSSPDNPITSMEQMVGKRIGGSQGIQTKFDAMFAINGLEPDYTFVPTGYGPDALINGDCDVQSGFITDEAIAYEVATGDAPTIFTFEDAGLPSYTLTIYTTTETLESKRDALKGFLRAAVIGATENEADPDAGATLAAEEYGTDAGLDLEEEKVKNAAYVPLQSSDLTDEHGYLWVDPERLSGPIFAGMEAAGLATAPIDTVLDTSLLEEIAEEG